ncbi:MAG: tetratricopeptide repeat protein [Alphaproteobacteria bacterium]|nr:tetratricopeptide repeat protein [Alphaproteobacteria bacterium]
MAGFDKVSGMFGAALSCHRSGNFAGADRRYHQILLGDHNHAHALHMLGLLAHNQGKPKWPSATFGERLRSATEIPSFHHNLGNILKEAGRQDEAAECYQRALDLGPTRSRRSPMMSVHFATAMN